MDVNLSHTQLHLCHIHGRRERVPDMITSRDLRALVTGVLSRHGFTKDGRVWRKRTHELSWIVELDRSPRAERFSIEIGASLLRLLTGQEPDRASLCKFLIHLENLPLAAPAEVPDPRLADFRSAVVAGFDPAVDIPDEARRELLTSVLDALGRYLGAIDTEDDLRAGYRAGDFKSAAIEKGLRPVLDRF
jgi:hypothetical protein